MIFPASRVQNIEVVTWFLQVLFRCHTIVTEPRISHNMTINVIIQFLQHYMRLERKKAENVEKYHGTVSSATEP